MRPYSPKHTISITSSCGTTNNGCPTGTPNRRAPHGAAALGGFMKPAEIGLAGLAGQDHSDAVKFLALVVEHGFLVEGARRGASSQPRVTGALSGGIRGAVR